MLRKLHTNPSKYFLGRPPQNLWQSRIFLVLGSSSLHVQNSPCEMNFDTSTSAAAFEQLRDLKPIQRATLKNQAPPAVKVILKFKERNIDSLTHYLSSASKQSSRMKTLTSCESLRKAVGESGRTAVGVFSRVRPSPLMVAVPD